MLLCREEELEAARADLASAPWLEPLVYGKDYEELAPFLRSLAPPGPGGATIPESACAIAGPGFDLRAYQQAMRKLHDRLKLKEVDPTTHDFDRLTSLGSSFRRARGSAEFMPRVLRTAQGIAAARARGRRAGRHTAR